MRRQSVRQRTTKATSTGLVAILVLGALGVAPAAGALPPAQNTTSFCTNAPSGFGGFTDTSDTIHRRPIECMAFAEVALGKGGNRYAPNDDVTRAQMASFIARGIDKANELERIDLPALPANPPDRFTDDAGNTHHANINRLAAAGVVSGTSATTFGPDQVVSRAQMATFINNAQRFLSEGQPFTSSEDYFVDDETNVHEANINAIAAFGVTQGFDRTRYLPDGAVKRANMATFIARYLAVLHKFGIIEPLPVDDGGPPAPPSNATLTFTPTAQSRVVVANEPSDVDDRMYTATGLQSRPYRVELFDAAKVIVDPGPVYTFTEAGTTGFADPGTVGGRIVEVNGSAVAPVQLAGAVTPVNGQIVVSVDAVSFGRLLPVIYPDEGGANAALNLNDANRPTEPFGVGGLLETIPPDAATGTLGADAVVLFNDEATDLIVATVNASERSFHYDANDSYYIDSLSEPNRLPQAQFELRLSTGDRLDGATSYNANPELSSTFILENISPAPPTPRVSSVGDTSAVITIDDLLPGAVANVFVGPDNASFAGATVRESTSVDGHPTEPGFQVNLSGLTPSTSYEYYVTQRSEGEESKPLHTTPSAQTELKTVAAAPPSVTAASVNGGRAGTTPKEINVDFSEPVTPLAGAPAKLTVVCTKEVPHPLLPGVLPGTTETTFSGAGTAVAQVDPNTLKFTLGTAVPNDGSTCKAALAAGAVQDVSNQPNAAQEVTVS